MPAPSTSRTSLRNRRAHNTRRRARREAQEHAHKDTPTGSKQTRAQRRRRYDTLDDALRGTFPASDPVAVY
jgi:predicted RNA polymerase sigma factor